MKKIIYMVLITSFLMSCGTYKRLDLGTLTFGMTTQEVIRIAGRPQRILAARDTPDGYQQVFEYRTAYDEIYALEFWNDYLTGYEFLYDDVVYVAPVLPPPHFPEYGRPIYIYPGRPRPDRPGLSNKPGRPERPTQPERPNRPEQPNRPSQPERPNRPSESTPSRPGRPSQSQTPGRGELTRPAETNQQHSGRENTPRESTRNPQQGETNPGRSGGR